MAKPKVQFECTECGHTTTKWMGNCPSCGEWNTFVELKQEGGSASTRHKAKLDGWQHVAKPQKLSEIDYSDTHRKKSGIPELDRVLGGGFMQGGFVLLGGDPGVGKSTLMLQLARSNSDLQILYCTGEESREQIKQRAERLGVTGDNMLVYTETDLASVLEQAKKEKPDLLIIDSIQTMYRTELSSMPGSVQQVKECAAMLQKLAKTTGITTLVIGHITKKGDLAGPRVLEHMVDTVLQFEGDENYAYRLLRCLKNRFGPAQEIGLFEMKENGLMDIENPSGFFISDYSSHISGNALICTMEGTRPLIIEVQALVTPSNYGVPQRTTTGFDHKKLALLLAVLEKRCNIDFSGHDVYLNVAGGIKITEPGCDLGVACALVSSMYDNPIQHNLVLIGEIGLGAELRTVGKIDQRLNEVEKIGMSHVMTPKPDGNESSGDRNINRLSVKNLNNALKKCFVKKSAT